MSSIHTLERQLQQALGLYQELKDSVRPLDKSLRLFFHEHRSFGAKDRRVISSAVYGMARHSSFIETWQQAAGEEAGEIFFPAAALVCEGLLEKASFTELIHIPEAEKIYGALRAGSLPENSPADKTEALALRYSFPLWLVRKWQKYFGTDTEALLQASNQRADLTVRVNALKTDRETLRRLLKDQNILAVNTVHSLWGLKLPERAALTDSKAFREGRFEIQDEGSQMIVLTLDPRPGETVWDACAGGGGKTIFAAALMNNQGRIVAADARDEMRKEVEKRALRAGVKIIESLSFEQIGKTDYFQAGFDRILIDAPCSGSGTLRRNPENKWRLTPEKITEYARAQKALLADYAKYLKPGGTLVYATCSLEAEENEIVADDFLKANPEFTRAQADMRFYPHIHGSDGFYIAKLVRA